MIAVTLAAPAHALDIDSAFKNVGGGVTGSVNKSGAYANSARTSFVVGGVDMRMPRSKVSLMSITPPSLNAGCNGISAHFGGFSFVSGEKIEELIDNIAANSTGMVIDLVLKTLCPICESAVAFMTKMAQEAAKLSIDSCQMADNLFARAGLTESNATGLESESGSVCGKKLANSGEKSSVMEAMDSACSTMHKAVGELEKLSNKPPAKDSEGKPMADAEKQMLPIGNITWELLKVAGYGGTDTRTVALRTLMLNLIGTQIIKSRDDKGQPVEAPIAVARTLDPDRAMDLFMCGTSPAFVASAGTSNTANAVCRGNAGHLGDEFSGGGEYDLLLSCENDVDKCLDPVYKKASEIRVFSEVGFLFKVSGALHAAVEDIRMDRHITDPYLLEMMETVPYPLYQILNTAAIYPVAAHDLVETMSAIVAESMATAMFEDVVRMASRAAGESYLSLSDLQNIQTASEKFLVSIVARKTLMGQRIVMQEAMMENIRTINIAIQKEVMGDELLGTSRFSSTVNGALADPSSGQ